jgi:hypothetical protein
VKNRKQVQIVRDLEDPDFIPPLVFEMPSTRREWPERFEYQWLFVYEPSMLNKVPRGSARVWCSGSEQILLRERVRKNLMRSR